MTNKENPPVSLREVFTPLFAYTLFLSRSLSSSERSFSTIRAEIRQLLADQEQVVRRHDLSKAEYETACFAVVAWIDELVLRSTYTTNREFYQQWTHAPLQVSLYNDANAGEGFFDKLAILTAAQKEVREVYYLCLALGFRGRYYDDAHQQELAKLRQDLAPHLPTPTTELFELEKTQEHITPQPYSIAPPTSPTTSRTISPLWMVLPLLVLAIFAVYTFWPFSQSPAAIQSALQQFTCCQVNITEFRSGVVRLDGQVESDAQRQKIEQVVRGISGVSDVKTAFTLVPRPFCEVIALLKPFRARSAAVGAGVKVSPGKGCEATYRKGEYLTVEVTAKRPLAYTYVDYYVADHENMAHVLPTLQQQENDLRAQLSITLGGREGKPPVWIEAPFGAELVTIISSPRPLFSLPRPSNTEQATRYLAELRQALPADATTSDITADYCFLTTTE